VSHTNQEDEMDAKTAKLENGSCKFDGVDYILLQQAYSANNDNAECGYVYQASAKRENEWDSDDADHYTVTWDVIDKCEDGDESGACDWDNPISVTKV
jgi:hypothetical protein